MGRCKSENTKFAYLTTFLEMGYQMAQVQNISFTKQTGQFRANLHTLQRFGNGRHRFKTISFIKQMKQLWEGVNLKTPNLHTLQRFGKWNTKWHKFKASVLLGKRDSSGHKSMTVRGSF